jgi:type IV pilus assembly protein PilM
MNIKETFLKLTSHTYPHGQEHGLFDLLPQNLEMDEFGNLPEGYETELLNPFVENLALEVSRALQFFFTSTQFNQVDHIVLSGGCAVIPGVDEVVATRTQVNTIVANPFANMVLSDKVKAKALLADSSSLMVACGLALRRFDPS